MNRQEKAHRSAAAPGVNPLEYGALRIDQSRRELLVDGTPVAVGRRAYEIAHLLVEAKGDLVSKNKIMQLVWPGTPVEENSIQVAISALRKALGERAGSIRTIAGRGYRLVVASTLSPKASSNLPLKTKSFVGRQDAVEYLRRLLGAHRVVTLTGSGGMGKTHLAIETARQLPPQFADGVWVAELATITDGRAVPHAVASALGLEIPDNLAQAKRIASLVATRKVLLVLDNCEHVIDAVADVAHTMVLANPNLRILATSREPLRIEGEVLYRVSPLSIPPNDIKRSDQLLEYESVRLFVERTQAMAPDFVLDDEATEAIATICRQLDGIPLAIEIAASRAAALGVIELSKHLGDQFRLLTSGFRTGLPRHQTMEATFDWSYDALAPAEQRGLRHLAVPVGRFTLDAAKILIADDFDPAHSAEEVVASLVEKSLVVTDSVGGGVRYRLPETTRAYALAKLRETGTLDHVARRHAEYWLNMLAAAELDWQGLARLNSLGSLEGVDPLGSARAAIDWALSRTDDATIGVLLTIAAVPVWMHFSMALECRDYVERALKVLAVDPRADLCLEMRLLTAHGTALLSTTEVSKEARRAFQRALGIAEHLDDKDYQLRNLWGLCSVCLNEGDFRAAQGVVEQFYGLGSESGDPRALAWADLFRGGVLSVLGELASARRHIERMVEWFDLNDEHPSSGRFIFNRRVLALGLLGNILCLQGHADQGKRRLEESVAEALLNDRVLSLCSTLANWVCVQTLEQGDLAEAEHRLNLVVDHASRYRLDVWLLWARCFKGALLTKKGDLQEGLRVFRTSFAELSGADHHPRFTRLRALYADALHRAGNDAEALTVVDEALGAVQDRGHFWMISELLRIKACIVSRQPGIQMQEEAEKILKKALSVARQQGSLSSQLRVAIGLVRLRHTTGPAEDARAVLREIYGQFREGFETTDLKEARTLLEAG